MRAALALLAAALGALYWLERNQAAAPIVAAGDASAPPAPDPGGSVDAPAPSVADQISAAADSASAAVFGAGQSLLDSLGTTMQKLFTLPASAAQYLDSINAASSAEGLPDGLLARLLYEESRFREDIISGATISPAGAVGIAQFMPATAADLGIDPTDPNQSIDAAAKYLRQLFDQLGSWNDAIAAYNWGVGNVKRKGLAAAPAETQKYVADITADVPNLT